MRKTFFSPFSIFTVLLAAVLLLCLAGTFSPVRVSSAQSPTGTPASGYPPFPTATALAPAVQQKGTFSDEASGVTVTIPNGWTTTPGAAGQTNLAEFSAPGNAVYASLFTSMLEPDETLNKAAIRIRTASFTGLEDLQTLKDEPRKLAGGADAWFTQMSCSLPGQGGQNSQPLKVSITTTLHNGMGISILVYGSPFTYASNQKAIDSLVGSMVLSAPRINGFPRDQALQLLGGESSNPRDYDPATTHGSGDGLVFTGLVSFGPQLQLLPELAQTWDISGEGTVYTFHISPKARFHNGRPVTAGDVVYSWERAANPKTASDTVLTYLGDVVGVREMRAGKAASVSGLKVLNDRTLQVTIDAPKPYFLLKLTYPTGFVVDRANVESGSDWYRTPNGTGPYRLVRWEPMKSILYERFADFYGDAPAIPHIVVQLYSGVGMRLYETGKIDITGVSSYDVSRVTDVREPLNADLRTGVDMCTGYISFDATRPPFDDRKVRQAFSMAFDRQKYIAVVLHGTDLPAVGPYPPAMPGYDLGLKGLPYDPAQARKLLQESKYGAPGAMPEIIYTTSGIGNEIYGAVPALVQMWQKTLGVKVTIENIEPDRYYDELSAGRHGQIFDGGWCADYPDPENFADALFHTGAEMNTGKYSNPEVDGMLEKARLMADVTERIKLYQKAARIIVEDAPVLFTTHSLSYVLVKPYVQGYVLSPLSTYPAERYLWLDFNKVAR